MMDGLWVTIMDMGIALAIALLLPIVLLVVEKPRDKNIAVLGGGRSVCNIFPVSGTDFTLFCADQAIGAF